MLRDANRVIALNKESLSIDRAMKGGHHNLSRGYKAWHFCTHFKCADSKNECYTSKMAKKSASKLKNINKNLQFFRFSLHNISVYMVLL